jgi:NAD(P)-dependent dehydrogenase (short-subunit alcohol dehydrogenase family)
MNTSLEHKTAVITGASKGIGRATALALAEAGAQVVLIGRSAGALEAVAGEIGAQAQVIVCDVLDEVQLLQAFARLERIDVLVNNAGTNIPEPFAQVTPAHFDSIFDLNVRAAFFASQHALAKMTRGGVIINVSSQMGHVGASHRSVYCASKHALEGLTKALAVELAPQGIRVVSVAPTFIETPLTRPMLEDSTFRQNVLASIPLGELGQPEDVAQTVVFLASSAARLITGSSVLVDGGWTAR